MNAFQVNPLGTETSQVAARLRAVFASGRTHPLVFRQRQLAGLMRFIKEREDGLQQVLREDLGKSPFEGFATEISHVAREIKFVQKRLPSWMKPERVSTPLLAQPGSSRIHREPLGVVLILGAWNYPVQLTLLPLIGAVAAGNCAIVKPSELAPATSAFLARHLADYLDSDCVQVVEGSVLETTELLAERFDHIFYTGGGTVGRIVMQAAARHLTPVTLELGGKSPCIVDCNTRIAMAARRILWGKFLNAGQTCVAPDYVLVHERVENELLACMRQTLREFFGDDPRTSPDYSRIVNLQHYRRLIGLLDESGDIVAGGDGREEERYLAPTILRNVPADAPIMKDEIFGPILPVLSMKDIEEAVAFVNARPKPLALYLFSDDERVRERVLSGTSSGGVTVNHTCFQMVVPSLPFGGVGGSGMGAYHGRTSFETFSHPKAVLAKPSRIDLRLFFPPYDANKMKWLRRLL